MPITYKDFYNNKLQIYIINIIIFILKFVYRFIISMFNFLFVLNQLTNYIGLIIHREDDLVLNK